MPRRRCQICADKIDMLSRSSQYIIIARKLVLLVESDPKLSKEALLEATAELLQLDRDALELAYDAECEW